MDDLELAQGTAYSYVNRLVDAGVVDVTDDEQPRRYAAREIDLTVTTAAGDREYTITPALIDAVGRRETDADIGTYIDRHSVAGLATALTYAAARERGEVTHRLITVRYDTRGVEVAATLADRLHGWPIGRGSVDVVCDCPPRPHGRST
jgi:hypothetical protein